MQISQHCMICLDLSALQCIARLALLSIKLELRRCVLINLHQSGENHTVGVKPIDR